MEEDIMKAELKELIENMSDDEVIAFSAWVEYEMERSSFFPFKLHDPNPPWKQLTCNFA